MQGPLERLKSRFLENSNSEEIKNPGQELENLITKDTRRTKDFNQKLVKNYTPPIRENIFLDENVIIDLAQGADRATTAYLPVKSEENAHVKGGDGKNYRRVDINEPLEETISLLEEAVTQNRGIFYPSTFARTESETNESVHRFLNEYGESVDVDPIPTSDYPEDAGITAAALERDAVIVTYDGDFIDQNDFAMEHSPEIYTPGQLYQTIRRE
jgi:hypothetical protein